MLRHDSPSAADPPPQNDALYYGLGSAPPCRATDPGKYECLNATTWNALHALSVAASSPLIVGLNIHPAGASSPPKGPWDATNARALLTSAKEEGKGIWALELGNEQVGEELANPSSAADTAIRPPPHTHPSTRLPPLQNTIMTASQQAGAFAVLAGVLDDVYGAGAADRPLLIGPDPHSFRDAGSALPKTVAYLADFARDTLSLPLSAITHHEYIGERG